jgi:hypothetical protein
MRAYAHLQGATFRPGMRCERACGLSGGRNRRGRGGESDEEGIALGVHLYPGVRGKRRAHERLVFTQHAGVVFAQVLEQPGGARNVGEQKGDSASGAMITSRLVSAADCAASSLVQVHGDEWRSLLRYAQHIMRDSAPWGKSNAGGSLGPSPAMRALMDG